MRRILCFATALAALAACRSTPPPVETAPTTPGAVPPSTNAPHKKARKRRLRVSEVAARAPDEHACEQAAVKLHGHSAKAGLALLVACIDQSKFRDLDGLFEDPWKAMLEKLRPVDRARLVGAVVAIRGADFKSDLPKLRERGVPIQTLSSRVKAQLEKKRIDPAALTIFRGVVIERRLQPSGAMRLRIAEIGRATVDRKALVRRYRITRDSSGRKRASLVDQKVTKVGSVDKRMLTGVQAEALVNDLPLLVREGAEFVFLTQVVRVDGASAGVRIVDVYKRGVILPDF